MYSSSFMNKGRASATINVLPPIKIRSFSRALLNAFSTASFTVSQRTPGSPFRMAFMAKSYTGIALSTEACVKK